MRDSQDHFDVLRKIQKKPKASQRELANDLGFSLGKLNYCIKSLQEKGLVKIGLSVKFLTCCSVFFEITWYLSTYLSLC